MKNLTPKQQEIIQSLKEQFAQINSVKPTLTSNPFLNYENEFNEIKQSESRERAIIEATNEAIRKVRDRKISDDYYYLDELLDDISDNIILTKKEKSLVLSKGMRNITIYYFIESNKIRQFQYVEGIEVLQNNINLDYDGRQFETIEDLITSDRFKSSFQSMLKFNPQLL